MRKIYVILAIIISAAIGFSSCSQSTLTLNIDQEQVVINLADSANLFLTGEAVSEGDYIKSIKADFFTATGDVVSLALIPSVEAKSLFFSYSINSFKGETYDYTDKVKDIKKIVVEAESGNLTASKEITNVTVVTTEE